MRELLHDCARCSGILLLLGGIGCGYDLDALRERARDAEGDAGETTEAGLADTGVPDPRDAGEQDAGGKGTCEPTGAEQCFNGTDDDCNGFTDCADAACQSEATCVPAGETMGVLVPESDSCPEGFKESARLLHRGLNGGGCTGCSCDATAPTCTAPIYFYASVDDCQNDAAPYGGGDDKGDVTDMCSEEPFISGDASGVRVGELDVTPGSCTPTGTPEPEPASWASTRRFCVASRRGSGCPQGFACVPAPAESGTLCGDGPDAETCPSSASEATWYEGYDDTRTCGTCQCDRSPGNCDDVQVKLGNDWDCATQTALLAGGEKDCDANAYSPPAELVGDPTAPACNPSASASGALTPRDAHTLCCLE